MEKGGAQPTPSVTKQLEASLKKASEQSAELKKLQGQMGDTLDQLSSARAG